MGKKKNSIKKFGAVALSATMLAGGILPSVGHAQTKTNVSSTVEEVSTTNLPGASEVNPDILRQTRGTSIPSSSKVWNVKTQGKYNFSGTSSYNELYTNYHFTGYAEYYVSVKNTGSKPIEVRVLKGISTAVKIVTVPAKSSKGFSVTGIKASEKIFFKFFGNGSSYSFSGSID